MLVPFTLIVLHGVVAFLQQFITTSAGTSASVVALVPLVDQAAHAFSRRRSSSERARALDSAERFFVLDPRKMDRLSTTHLDEWLAWKRQRRTNDTPEPTFDITLDDLRFTLRRSHTLCDELQARYPDIHSFRGHSVAHENESHSEIRLEWTSEGLHAKIWHHTDASDESDSIQVIEPALQGDRATVSIFEPTARESDLDRFEELVPVVLESGRGREHVTRSLDANGDVVSLRSLRLALSLTSGYTAFHGGTVASALAAASRQVNRISQVFERDVAVTFQLFGGEDLIIFEDATNDPFASISADTSSMASFNSRLLVDMFNPEVDYDLGVVWDTRLWGGVAAIRGSCSGTSIAGYSSLGFGPFPSGVLFEVIAAHELGHMLGMQHTWVGGERSCRTSNFANGFGVEPGSGSSVMSYGGRCASDNTVPYGLWFFNGASIRLTQECTMCLSCARQVLVDHAPPTVSILIGAERTVPTKTPFRLSANGTSHSGVPLLYSWDQIDTTSTQISLGAADGGVGPRVNALPPTRAGTRYLPRLSSLRTGELVRGEQYFRASRNANFRVTARDGLGGIAQDDILIVFSSMASGPFEIVAPATGSSFAVGERDVSIEWSVSDTASPPFNAAHVDILLSINDGLSFDYTLVSRVENSGVALVTLPSGVASSAARVMVRATDSLFFCVSTGSFEIVDSDTTADPVGSALDWSAFKSHDQFLYDGVCENTETFDVDLGTWNVSNGGMNVDIAPRSLAWRGDGCLSLSAASAKLSSVVSPQLDFDPSNGMFLSFWMRLELPAPSGTTCSEAFLVRTNHDANTDFSTMYGDVYLLGGPELRTITSSSNPLEGSSGWCGSSSWQHVSVVFSPRLMYSMTGVQKNGIVDQIELVLASGNSPSSDASVLIDDVRLCSLVHNFTLVTSPAPRSLLHSSPIVRLSSLLYWLSLGSTVALVLVSLGAG